MPPPVAWQLKSCPPHSGIGVTKLSANVSGYEYWKRRRSHGVPVEKDGDWIVDVVVNIIGTTIGKYLFRSL